MLWKEPAESFFNRILYMQYVQQAMNNRSKEYSRYTQKSHPAVNGIKEEKSFAASVFISATGPIPVNIMLAM